MLLCTFATKIMEVGTYLLDVMFSYNGQTGRGFSKYGLGTYVYSLRVSWEKSRSAGATKRAAGMPVGSRSHIQGDLQQFVLEATVLRMPVFKPYPSQYTPYPDYAEFIMKRLIQDTTIYGFPCDDRHVPTGLRIRTVIMERKIRTFDKCSV